MRKKDEKRTPWFWAGAALLGAAALLRFLWIGYGLPHTYNADEPHLINMAVSFGGGSLRPHSFKYPTLWPELLAGLYGLWFAFWSAFGLRKGPTDFAALYGFAPTGFYLIARCVSALASFAAVLVVARIEKREAPSRWPYGAWLLAFAPQLVDLGHTAKPDMLMHLFAAGAWACALRYRSGGPRGWLIATGACVGAACSTQYTTAPLALLVPLAWALRDGGPTSWTWLAQATLAAAAAFFLASPFVLIEPGRFLADWSDYFDLGRQVPRDVKAMSGRVVYNMWTFGGDGSPAGLAALAGLFLAARRSWRRALLLGLPCLAYVAVLSFSFDGGWQRYMLGAFPALAVLAGEGLSPVAGESPRRRAAVLALSLLPGAWMSWSFDSNLSLPDTRAQAEAWMTAHVPAGETVLLDLPHASPRLIPSKEQCADLAARTAAAGSPRSKLWKAMADRHPGGGWRVYRVRRSAVSLFSAPGHVANSELDGDFLDVRPGLDPVRAVRAGWVVTSSFGADPRKSRELATFFSELAAGADLAAEFPFEAGKTAGPWLRVWKLRR